MALVVLIGVVGIHIKGRTPFSCVYVHMLWASLGQNARADFLSQSSPKEIPQKQRFKLGVAQPPTLESVSKAQNLSEELYNT